MRTLVRSLLLVGLLLAVPLAPAAAAEPASYFAPTGHSVSGAFLTTYQKLGGLDRFGYPRTEALVEGGRLVQYFQRAVMERFPEHAGTPYEVQLRLLGDTLTQGARDRAEWTPIARPAAPSDARYYPETRHSIRGQFLAYYDRTGGLYSYGYPISEPMEVGELVVQYFQRARFEYHEGNPVAYRVQLGLLGDELIASSWPAGDPRLAAVPAPVTREATWSTGRISIATISDVGRYNAAIAVSRLDGVTLAPGQRLDFDDTARSWDGHEDPVYLMSKGTSCTGGLVAMRGGGVCYVSTALWRAWMEAGLRTVLRVSHSGLLDDFGAGYDAANTLVVENDSAATLRLVVKMEASEVTVSVVADRPLDRRATIRGPVKLASGSYVVYRDVEFADGRRATSAFNSTYCW